MEDSAFPVLGPVAKRVAPLVLSVLVGASGVVYAVHERHAATNLAARNQQVSAQLSATDSQLNVLNAKVNDLMSLQDKPSPAAPAPERPVVHRRAAIHRTSAQDLRFKKIESQLDAQGKEIDATRSDLASTRTELTGSIARTHGELVVLEKKGERNYFEFDIAKSKEFKHEGPMSLRLKKADAKHGFADLLLVVDDRNLTQKHVNLYQPVMFYEPDSPQPVEVVINDISKDHIHGYVSAPKYSQSELTAMADNGNNGAPGNPPGGAQGTDDGVVGNPQPAPRQKLTVPAQDPTEQ
ncbi:MAG TPA: hypothetical protein VMD55_02525 [Terracidiphilus sp.]|nr:hypothetical protein [Terracidiphilus sp.]